MLHGFAGVGLRLAVAVGVGGFAGSRGGLRIDVGVVAGELFGESGDGDTLAVDREGLVGDGLATAFAGFFGGPANTTYGENTGVLALSKVYDPRVVRLAAIYAIILSFSPKFDALVNSIPAAIVGGVSFILYGMISAVGVRNIVENQVDLTKSRNLIIAAVMFVSGLGFSSVGGITFTVGGAAVTLSGLAIAALCGVILNAILPGNDYEFGVSVTGDKSADLGSY